MDGDFVLDLDEVMDSLENGEVISLSFQTFNKALVIDTRASEREGPLVCVCPVVESPRERVRSLRKMRPTFPRASNLTVIPWPKSVASLVSLGVWDKLVSRFERDGHYEAANIQIVCRFVNFWKSDTPDEEFRRLLALVRGEEELD